MGKKKTDLEIQAEWKLLKKLKPQLPHYDRYKVNQWKMIAAQIKTLYDRLTLPEVKERWPDGDINGACEDAIYWARGGDIFSPAEAWNILLGALKKVQKTGG